MMLKILEFGTSLSDSNRCAWRRTGAVCAEKQREVAAAGGAFDLLDKESVNLTLGQVSCGDRQQIKVWLKRHRFWLWSTNALCWMWDTKIVDLLQTYEAGTQSGTFYVPESTHKSHALVPLTFIKFKFCIREATVYITKPTVYAVQSFICRCQLKMFLINWKWS